MTSYIFYYDESEHSRKINHTTVSASNYYDNFITTVVGWKKEEELSLERKYLDFEQKYENRQKNGELKSTSIKNKQLQSGFASLSKENLQFLEDFLNLFDDRIFIQFSVVSKVEYIISQLFQNYRNSIINIEMLTYSTTKLIMLYRPRKIFKSIYDDIQKLPQLLIEFCGERLVANEDNLDLKQRENNILAEIIFLLKDINEEFEINWNYEIAFLGFRKYLNELKINDYSLILDNEGEEEQDSKTLIAAKLAGLNNIQEKDSQESFGLRMADMLAGIVSKFLKALNAELRYKDYSDGINKKLLSVQWFRISNKQFRLYKKLYYVITELNEAWYKAYAGNYSDDLITFVGLLEYISHFRSFEEFKKQNIKLAPEYCNAHICEKLEWHFQRMGTVQNSSFNVEYTDNTKKDYLLNKQGGKIYFDFNRQPSLEINEGTKVTYEILSVGLSKQLHPIATISNNGIPVAYRLPEDLGEWVTVCIGISNMGDKLFPAKVRFTRLNGKIYADFI